MQSGGNGQLGSHVADGVEHGFVGLGVGHVVGNGCFHVAHAGGRVCKELVQLDHDVVVAVGQRLLAIGGVLGLLGGLYIIGVRSVELLQVVAQQRLADILNLGLGVGILCVGLFKARVEILLGSLVLVGSQHAVEVLVQLGKDGLHLAEVGFCGSFLAGLDERLDVLEGILLSCLAVAANVTLGTGEFEVEIRLVAVPPAFDDVCNLLLECFLSVGNLRLQAQGIGHVLVFFVEERRACGFAIDLLDVVLEVLDLLGHVLVVEQPVDGVLCLRVNLLV